MTDFPKVVVIIGAGDNGREVAEIAKRVELSDRSIKLIGFLDDNEDLWGKEYNGIKVLGGIDCINTDENCFGQPEGFSPIYFVCSITNPKIKKKVVKEALEHGYKPINIIDPTVIIHSGVKIGKGVIINCFCAFMPYVEIGDHVHINLFSCMGHNVKVGDYCSLSPNTMLMGFVELKEGVLTGVSTNVIPHKTIGKYAVTGAGACIVHDVEAYKTVKGVPAK